MHEKGSNKKKHARYVIADHKRHSQNKQVASLGIFQILFFLGGGGRVGVELTPTELQNKRVMTG